MTSDQLPTVIVAYGAADVPESWELVRRALAGRFELIVPRRVPGIDPVAQLAAVIDAQEQAPIVVGHSYGGLIARAAASRSVHRIAGLVLVDATSPRTAGSRVARGVLAAATLGLDLAAVLAASRLGRLLASSPAVPLVPEEHAFRSAVDDATYRAWRAAVVAGIADGTAANEMEAVIPTASRGVAVPLPSSSVGVAVVHSSGLTRLLERPARSLTRRVVDVTATGDRFHNIHLAHPEAIAGAVLSVAASPAPLREAVELPVRRRVLQLHGGPRAAAA